MSFRGRSIGVSSGVASGVVGYDQNIVVISSIQGIPIEHGIPIVLTYSSDDGYDADYRVYEVDGDGLQAFYIGDQSDSPITHTVWHSSTRGIAFVSRDTPGPGDYRINWEISTTLQFLDNPIAVLRYLKQMQNWSELGASYNWGKEVVPEALIKTTGEGSFDDESLDEIKSLKIARQIHDYSSTWTDELVQSICEEFFLVSYQDENGYECVKSLLTKENPATAVVFGDITGDVGDVIEAQMSNIYCTPVFNYAYDHATESYTKQLRVDNVWEDTYDPSFTSGFDGADGEEFWLLCRQLWLKTRQIEPMPANLSDRKWAPDYITAVWCLRRLLQTMTTVRCSFGVGYTLGRKWDVGTHFMLQLPHQTNNRNVECVIEGITKSKKNNKVTAYFAFLDELTEENILTLKYLQEGDYGFFEVGDAGFLEQ